MGPIEEEVQRNNMACTRPLVRVPTKNGEYRIVSLKGYIEHTGLFLNQNADKKTQARNEKKIKEQLKSQDAQLLP